MGRFLAGATTSFLALGAVASACDGSASAGALSDGGTNDGALEASARDAPDTIRGAGTLDTSFGTEGVLDLALDFRMIASAVQADGKLVLVGHTLGPSAGAGRVARFEESGATDTTFGVDGVVSTPLQGEPGGVQWRGVAIDAMSRIVVVGDTYVGGTQPVNQQTVLGRFLPSGEPDTTFGNGGLATIDVPARDGERLNAIAALPDGSLVVAGEHRIDPGGFVQSLMIKVSSTGVRDEAFGLPELLLPYSAQYITALSLSTDRIYAVGNSLLGWFGADGAFQAGVELEGATGDVALTHVAQDSSGRVFTAGFGQRDSTATTLSARWTPPSAGSPPALDVPWGSTNAGTNEEVVCEVSTAGEAAAGLVVQPDGKAVVLATVLDCPGSDDRGVVLYRYTSVGDRDPGFGLNGAAIVYVPGKQITSRSLHWTPSSKLLVVGSPGDGHTTLMRFWP